MQLKCLHDIQHKETKCKNKCEGIHINRFSEFGGQHPLLTKLSNYYNSHKRNKTFTQRFKGKVYISNVFYLTSQYGSICINMPQ